MYIRLYLFLSRVVFSMFCFVMTHSTVYFRLIVSKSKIENDSQRIAHSYLALLFLFITDRLLFLSQYIWYRWVVSASEKWYEQQIQTILFLFIIEVFRIESQIVMWMLTFRWTQFVKQTCQTFGIPWQDLSVG